MTAQHAAPYVFVSYASADRKRVLPVVDALERAGISIWLDQSGIPGGTLYGAEIAAGIEHAMAMVLMCTPASLTSRNVKQEILLGWKFQKSYLPLLLEPCEFPKEIAYWLEGSQWIEVLDRPEATWLPQRSRILIRCIIYTNPRRNGRIACRRSRRGSERWRARQRHGGPCDRTTCST